MLGVDKTHIFRRHKQEVIGLELDDYLREILENYTHSEQIENKQKAVRDLLIKGYWYWLLEKKYGKEKASSREAWDKTYSCLKIESGYLYYRLRLSDVIKELRNLLFVFSGLLSDLSTCHYELKKRDPKVRVDENRVKEYKDRLNKYMKEYVLSLRKELETRKYVEDEEEFLEELEEIIHKYRERFYSNEK